MIMAHFTPVPAVPASAPRSGLVRSAITPNNDDDRWMNGVVWRSERCPSATTYDPCSDTIPAEVGPGPGGLNYYLPVALRTTDECSTRSSDLSDLPGRARRTLEGVTSYWTARELWTGERSAANPYDTPEDGGPVSNRRLAQVAGVTVVAGVHQPKHGLGALEEAARGEDGSQGMDVWIHVPLELLPLLEGAIVREGDMWFTQSGARVVFDAGYPGTAPDGTETAGQRFIYATGPVTVRLGPINASEIVRRENNRVEVVAERMIAAYFDSCVHFGLAVSVPATT
jgi:hypothetical protein